MINLANGCMTVTLRWPDKHGRLTAAMAAELVTIAERVEDDDSVLMLMVTGEGGVFCRGFDDVADGRVVESIAAIAKPTIALINGDAIDEGLELALACDIRVAARGARFALTQLGRGRIPNCGATQRLPRIAGPAHALMMILSGAPIDAAEAMRIGLVSRLARDRRGLERAANEIRAAIGSRAPLAARLAKEAVLKGADMTLAQGVRLEEDLYALLQTTADRAEGVRAFLNKRRPLFKGV